MTYIQEFEAELQKKLEGSAETTSIVRWVSEKVLESYKNGITAGQKGVKVIRQGESRRRGMSGKAEYSAALSGVSHRCINSGTGHSRRATILNSFELISCGLWPQSSGISIFIRSSRASAVAMLARSEISVLDSIPVSWEP